MSNYEVCHSFFLITNCNEISKQSNLLIATRKEHLIQLINVKLKKNWMIIVSSDIFNLLNKLLHVFTVNSAFIKFSCAMVPGKTLCKDLKIGEIGVQHLSDRCCITVSIKFVAGITISIPHPPRNRGIARLASFHEQSQQSISFKLQ